MQLQLTAVFERFAKATSHSSRSSRALTRREIHSRKLVPISPKLFASFLKPIAHWPRNRSVVETSFASRSACLLEAPRPRSGSRGSCAVMPNKRLKQTPHVVVFDLSSVRRCLAAPR
jgi:hypothetical protein